MTDFFFNQTAAELQANHDKVSATTGALVDEDNIEQISESKGFSKYTENRIKGQQNWNIPDPSGDPLISSTPTPYSVGEFPAVNVEVVNANAVNLRRVGDLVIGDSGTLRHYARGAYRAGVIDETTEYMGIKDHLGNQLEAGVTPGVTKGNNGVDLYVDVDLAQFPNGFKFAGISAERGLWPEVSDEESIDSYVRLGKNQTYKDVLSSRSIAVTYNNDEKFPIEVSVMAQPNGVADNLIINVGGALIERYYSLANQTVSVGAIVPPGESYELSATNTGVWTVLSWKELRV